MGKPSNPGEAIDYTDAYAHHENYGTGGRYIINGDGQRVPAPAEDAPLPAASQEEMAVAGDTLTTETTAPVAEASTGKKGRS